MSGSTPVEFTCPISMDIMNDPVIIQCGHTFDRQSLDIWLDSNSVCPTCRVNVNRHEISTNYSLKSMIENSLQNGGSYRPSSSASNASRSAEDAEVADKTVLPRVLTIEDLYAIEGSYYHDTNSGLIQVSLKSPESEKRNAMSFVCVIDVSGSMGSIVGAGEGGKAFTRLDLVKHVLNVLIVSLTEHDTLSLITYSNDTKILSNPLNMTKKNKSFLTDRIKNLQTESSTYTGEAIKKAYEIMKKSPKNSMKSIILLTDGQDTEGYSILERKFEKVDKDPSVQFNTFGFSNDIWSDLLFKLALKGGGIFGFIPDQSMIGTIFINFIANTFELFAQNLKIQIDEKNYEFVQRIENKKIALKYGNSRHFMIRKKESAKEDCEPRIHIGFSNEKVEIPLVKQLESEQFKSQNARYVMLDLISNNVLESHEIKAFEKQLANMQDFANELSPGRDNDQKNDQVNLSYKNWATWGAHYIRSFRFAHLNEQCLNFKAPSMKMYRNDKFDDIVDSLTDLFCTLPPPKPTGIVFSRNVNVRTINMNTLMDADAGCILGTCMVKLRNDETKEIMQLNKGDVLEDGSRVKCVLITKFSGEMVKIGNLVITPYHPIIFDGEWQFPIDVLIENSQKKLDNPYMVMVKAPKPNWVCQLVLDKNHIINAEGFKCIGLGHGFKQGVLKHDYYGTERILKNLSMFEGWEKGKVSLKSYRLVRDSNGMVNGMDRPVYATPSPL